MNKSHIEYFLVSFVILALNIVLINDDAITLVNMLIYIYLGAKIIKLEGKVEFLSKQGSTKEKQEK